MKMSPLVEISASRSITESFGGYNHNIRIGESEFYDMQNLTSSHYPVFSPRDQRGTYEYPASQTPVEHEPNGIIAKDALCYVDGATLYINNSPVSGLTLTDSKKQLISMGAYIIIMPDRKYVNTANTTDKGNIEASFSSVGTVTYELCRIDGSVYENATVSDEEPTDPVNGALWINTSVTPHTLLEYTVATTTWVSVATTYVRISAAGIAHQFNIYDGVKIDGISSSIPQLQDLNGQTSILWGINKDEENSGAGDWIVVVGIIDEAAAQTSVLSVSRSMPDLDFVIESNNRLWGCRYGLDGDGNMLNEIYASKLGDFKNWNCFMGISTDSYVASCGTDGQWTGAVTHLGYPCFFKENFLHKVYGNFPSNFQVQTTACRGVQKGCGNSLAIVNERLFYKSRNGVCVYDGSLPVEISEAFGSVKYTAVDDTDTDTLRNGAVAGSLGNKYYISMKSEADNLWHLFVYDTTEGMWHREDNTRADAFAECRGDLYYIDHDTKKIRSVGGTGTKDALPIEWMAETGVIGTSIPDKKYVSRLLIRMSLAIGAQVRFYIQYDSCGEWEHVCNLTGTTLRSFSVPIRPKRCDHFRVRITGRGEAKIFSVVKTLEQGSDL